MSSNNEVCNSDQMTFVLKIINYFNKTMKHFAPKRYQQKKKYNYIKY